MNPVSRRRFLAISAATLVSTRVPAFAAPVEWQGFAFGSDVSIKLYGAGNQAKPALEKAVARMKELERIFSIYDPESELSQLNANGALANPTADFVKLMKHVDLVHDATGGLFDPTVQRIFEAKAQRIPYTVITAASSTGWNRISHSDAMIRFPDPAMGLTFNGIAQGYITDEVRKLLSEAGYEKTLVNIGEYAAGDRVSKIGIADHVGEIFEIAEIKSEAIATSSPDGYRFRDGSSHIISPDGRALEPVWKTVSVIAKEAVLADGFSTALVLAPDIALAQTLKANGFLKKAILQTNDRKIISV